MMQELDIDDDDGNGGEEAKQHFQKVLFQANESSVVYLDSCTTKSMFVGEENLSDVEDVKGGLTVQCNAGKVKTNRRGNFGRLKVWAMKDGIANVLSLGEMIKEYLVTFESLGGYFSVHMPSGEVRFVLDSKKCLLYTSARTRGR